MKDDTTEDSDPPPDTSPSGISGFEDGAPDSGYSDRHSEGYDPDREYRNFVLPNEDDDPKYHECLLRSYRGEKIVSLMDRGWRF